MVPGVSRGKTLRWEIVRHPWQAGPRGAVVRRARVGDQWPPSSGLVKRLRIAAIASARTSSRLRTLATVGAKLP